ncbi:hypothetical protein R0J87_18590, partial [Halomonas sp. SIMBA_159]
GDTYMMSLFSHDIVAHKRLEIEAIREQSRAIASQAQAMNRLAAAVEAQNGKMDDLITAVNNISVTTQVTVPDEVLESLQGALNALRNWLGPAQQ